MQSEADAGRARKLLAGLEHLVVQDIFLTKTAEMADVVLPAAAAWCESEGTVTNSERRVQRVRKALEPPGGARDDIEILCELARAPRHATGATRPAEEVWDELRAPVADARRHELRAARGAGRPPVAVSRREAPRHPVPARPAVGEDPARSGTPAPFMPVEHEPPVDKLSPEFPIRLTTGRRLDSFNTGVQTGGVHVAAAAAGDARSLARGRGTARRGRGRGGEGVVAARVGGGAGALRRVAAARARVHDAALPRRGRDQHAHASTPWDPKSGTAEFKATAIRVEKLPTRASRRAGDESCSATGRCEGLSGPAARAPRPQATDEERAAVASVLGPPESGWDGRAAHGADGMSRSAATRRGPGGTCCCRRCTRCRSGSAGSARARSTTSASRLSVPPAEAYGVASFYAMFRTSPARRAVVHVCDDIACRAERRGAGVRGDGAPLRRRGRRARSANGSAAHLAAQPVPGPVRARLGGPGPALRARTRPGAGAGAIRSRAGAGRRSRPQSPAEPRRRRSSRRPRAQTASRAPAAAAGRRRRPGLARRLPRARRLRGAAPRARARAAGRDPRGEGRQAARPRRRGVPDRPEVGGGGHAARSGRTTSSATPTNPSPARSRTGS